MKNIVRAWIFIAALGLAACSDGTSILIEITSSDLSAPEDVDGVEIHVLGAESGGVLGPETFVLPGPFPHTYRVYPKEGHDSEAVTITVNALLEGSPLPLRRIVHTEFISGTHRTINIDLDRACVGVTCADGVDCVGGLCGGERPDGGYDAAIDAGCMSNEACSDGIDCTTDVCDMGGCTSTPDDSLCASGEVCHAASGCGAPCTGDEDCDDGILCNGTETCTASSCGRTPIDCDDSVDCTVDECSEEFGCTHAPNDALCDDGDTCDGDDTCDVTAGCVGGTPLACDDLNDCTDDGCAASTCTATTRDVDDDGFGDMICPEVGGVAATDCDDADPAVRPGAPEVCNGEDDNCDGTPDETFACAAGTSGECTTTCGSTGSRICDGACRWATCTPPVETCNGMDDDCDGTADEGFDCIQALLTPCTTSCGTAGTRTCSATCTQGTCDPPAEICEDGIDQDCDGRDTLCRECPGGTDEECGDGDFCNGVETCYRGTCVPGLPILCNDGIPCTDDGCEPTTGGCVFTASDANCLSDGNFCNGAELCQPSAPTRDSNGCVHEGTPSCDDSNTCTEEGCVGTAPGMCVATTRDLDDDGHGDLTCTAVGGVAADDCDDADRAVFPGAPELCNGGDDDCDGTCDDGFACCRASSGSCTTSCGTTGARVCSAVCSWGICTPPAETCNGIDDDCNSACDDAFACCQGSTGPCISSCGSMGSRLCSSSCGWGSCTAPAETCSGVDDDCDGQIDEGFTCRAGAPGTCTTSCGSTGSRTCTSACEWGTCNPPVEECNARDDDCDGMVDDGFTCAPGATRSCTTGCGTAGVETCTAGCNWGACVPPAETCNGLDDDCDTFVDDGFTCAAGASGPCSTSCGTTGNRTCSASCEWGTCNPPAEVCNGSDDDCDMQCDDGFACCRGTTGTCTTSCGSQGTQLCGATCGWGACTPPAEVCNGTDDDCDMQSDEGFACRAGSTGSCTTSCGTTGSQVCSGTCSWGSCTPPPEACNGLDDDCDGMTDEMLECVSGSMGPCTTTCGSTGQRTCGASCTWGTCAPPAETCNGADDDCDGQSDEGFDCPAGSNGSCSTTCGSTGTRTCSGTCAWGSCTPPAEVCNGVDDDCDGLQDEGFDCDAGTTGTCTTSCGTSGMRTCSASCSWGMCNPPSETCNGVDDDCDTLVDDGFECASGSTSTCLSSCGTTGSRACSGTCAWGTCTPPSETCNGLDDDCDGLRDETFTCQQGSTGSCTTSCGSTGSQVCSASCAWGTCTPPGETCNGLDDDCDGMRDETFACQQGTTGSCGTSCGSTGTRTCSSACGWGSCVPPTETCNGVDDDCDGFEDEGFTCDAGSTGTCTTSCGSTGSQTCTSSCAWGTCVAPSEVCNGADDDCDGMIDDGFTCAPGATGSCTTSCGTTGTQTCTSSCGWGSCTPPAEVCNGADDDCDGLTDETFTCVPGSTGSCTASCGTTGSRTCTSSCTWGACNAPAEVCNGADDDCDMTCDDGFECCRGLVGTCTTGCGSSGTRSCGSTCAWGSCIPPAETCNGLDDDCLGGCDNGFTCCAGTTGSCTTSCGSTGSRTCSASCAWGATCTAPAETCNGMDDDCVGGCDNGFTCCQGATTNCTTTCGSTGTQTCNSTCSGYGACTPPVENCTNGADDDCDGQVDCADTGSCGTNPSCMGCSACTGATSVTAPGGRYSVTLGTPTHTGSCGGAGSEAYLTFTIAAPQDVYIATHGAGIDTTVYVRSCSCTGTEVGCNDNADGQTTSALRLTNLPAGTYNVIIDSAAMMSASVNVHLYITNPGAASDRCGNPTFLPAGTTSLMGSTCTYTNDEQAVPTTGCTYTDSGASEDRIFAFYLPTSRSVSFNGCGAGTLDSVVYIRSVCTDDALAQQVFCNDDGCSGGAGCTAPRYRSAFTTTLGPGLYYAIVDGFPYAAPCNCGDYSFAISGL